MSTKALGALIWGLQINFTKGVNSQIDNSWIVSIYGIYKEFIKISKEKTDCPKEHTWAKGMNRQISEQETQSDSQIYGKVLSILAYRGMQIKLKLHWDAIFKPVWLVKIENFVKISCWGGCEERGALMFAWECKMIRYQMWGRLLHRLPIPFPGIHFPDTFVSRQKAISTKLFSAALSIKGKSPDNNVNIHQQVS